jgi:hypothetical protein
MAIEFKDVIEWVWTVPLGILGYSFDQRLRNKVDKGTCEALHGGLISKFDDMKKHVDQRFDDHAKFYKSQIDRVIREVKKNNNGG